MTSRKSYGKRMKSGRRGYSNVSIRLRQASQKLSQARETIRLENQAIRTEPDYDPGTDLDTEAKRIESAELDIQEALRIIEGGEIKTLGELQISRGNQLQRQDFPYEGIKDELSGVEKDIVRKYDPTFSATYVVLTDPADGSTQEIWAYKGEEDSTDPSLAVVQIR